MAVAKTLGEGAWVYGQVDHMASTVRFRVLWVLVWALHPLSVWPLSLG